LGVRSEDSEWGERAMGNGKWNEKEGVEWKGKEKERKM